MEGRGELLKRCTKCLLPESYPRIAFDSQGVCNYCLAHQEIKYPGQEILLDWITAYKNNSGEYECIVAISGGRDSAFAAHYAVKVLNLRALAYTYDNGFMPEQTKENVRNTVDILGLDHVMEKNEHMRESVKHVLSAWIRHPSPGMIALLCTGCLTGFKRGLAKITQDNNTELVISGAGEPAKSFAAELLSISDSDYFKRNVRLAMILGALKEIVENPYYLNPSCLVAFAKEFFYRFSHRAKDYKYVPLLRFIGWDEDMILSVIREELRWEVPSYCKTSWRSDCKVHLLRQYLYRETLGFTKNDELLSRMIRENIITRENALKRLENENVIPHQFLTAFLDELGLDFTDLDMALREYGKTTK